MQLMVETNTSSQLYFFFGVNHHKQTTVFGAAVVSNETEETYVWLLEKFLEAMNGKQPKWTKKANDVQGVNFQQCELSERCSSAMKNVDNATGDQVRDLVRVRAKGRVSEITSRPKRGNQCGICREIGHNRASCPNVVGSCSRTFDNDFDEE
ncbi:hypothetical protein Lal_00023569 [Lupinus albus]|nr:hypothetical protein Lal_00023569 [Lupinus albus]